MSEKCNTTGTQILSQYSRALASANVAIAAHAAMLWYDTVRNPKAYIKSKIPPIVPRKTPKKLPSIDFLPQSGNR